MHFTTIASRQNVGMKGTQRTQAAHVGSQCTLLKYACRMRGARKFVVLRRTRFCVRGAQLSHALDYCPIRAARSAARHMHGTRFLMCCIQATGAIVTKARRTPFARRIATTSHDPSAALLVHLPHFRRTSKGLVHTTLLGLGQQPSVRSAQRVRAIAVGHIRAPGRLARFRTDAAWMHATLLHRAARVARVLIATTLHATKRCPLRASMHRAWAVHRFAAMIVSRRTRRAKHVRAIFRRWRTARAFDASEHKV